MPLWRPRIPARLGVLVALVSGAIALPCAAQEPPPEAPTSHENALEQRLESLEQQLAQMQAERQEAELRAADDEEHRLKLFGFTDFVVGQFFAPASSEVAAVESTNLYFAIWHLNLFLDKRLSSSFHTQAEVRFTWVPLGTETSLESPGTPYQRTDTTAVDPFLHQVVRWGSIIIERAWIEYQPRDWFALRAGRFLTPFGIWNEEHGTTVLIPARQPLFLISEMMPAAQSGFWVHGRVFPRRGVYADYGITFSNGRGPLDTISDLDANKAVGARARVTWEGALKLSLGAFYYAGDYTDIKKRVVRQDPLQAESVTTVAYTEHTISGDLLVEWNGLRFQAEVLYGSVVYKGRYREIDPIALKPLADHLRNGGYVLLAYRLPFPFAELRPYVMYDHFDTNNNLAGVFNVAHFLGGGVNWRITPETVAKVELDRCWVPRVSSSSTQSSYALAAQLAASF